MTPALSGFISPKSRGGDGYTHAVKEVIVLGRKVTYRRYVGWCGEMTIYGIPVVTFATSAEAPIHPACVSAVEDAARRKA